MQPDAYDVEADSGGASRPHTVGSQPHRHDINDHRCTDDFNHGASNHDYYGHSDHYDYGSSDTDYCAVTDDHYSGPDNINDKAGNAGNHFAQERFAE